MKNLTKKIIFATCLTVLTVTPLQAATLNENNVLQIMSTMNIMSGDGNGNYELGNLVTRAEFTSLLIRASEYYKSVPAVSYTSPFTDVPYTHWGAAQIKTAVQNKLVSGYTDGTFRPENNIKLEEAVSATLRLLGYSDNDFGDGYPYAQMQIYQSINMDANVSANLGENITRRDAMYIIYNLLNSNLKNGNGKYVESLGYKVNSLGQIDTVSVIIEKSIGPITIEDSSWYAGLGLNLSNLKVYRNGDIAEVSDIELYDVIYYSKELNSVWAYNDRVTGIYNSATPSRDTLTEIELSGKTYNVSSINAFNALSSEFNIGDPVTLLLDRKGEVADAINPEKVVQEKYVYVLETGPKIYESSNGGSYEGYYAKVITLDGDILEYPINNTALKAGKVAQISFANNRTKIGSVFSLKNDLGGTVNVRNLKIGSKKMAEDIRILDVSESKAIEVTMDRLDGVRLDSEDVLLYTLNDDKEVDGLILNNVTGDLMEYGILLSRNGDSGDYTYRVNINGNENTWSCSVRLEMTSGAVGVQKQNGQISNIFKLDIIRNNISSINELYATVNGEKYYISDNVVVYLKKNEEYLMSNFSEVKDLEKYSLKLYSDGEQNEGGRIRLIIAEEK